MENPEILGSYEPKGTLELRNGTDALGYNTYKVVDIYHEDGQKESVVASFRKPLSTVFPPALEEMGND